MPNQRCTPVWTNDDVEVSVEKNLGERGGDTDALRVEIDARVRGDSVVTEHNRHRRLT